MGSGRGGKKKCRGRQFLVVDREVQEKKLERGRVKNFLGGNPRPPPLSSPSQTLLLISYLLSKKFLWTDRPTIHKLSNHPTFA